MIHNRLFRFALSFVLTVAIMGILVVSASSDEPSRIIVMLGGTLPEGLIQGVTYLLFFFGMAELLSLQLRLQHQADAFSLHPLPEEENYVIGADDAGELKLRMQKRYRHDRFWLIDLIISASSKYRLSHSSAEAMAVVDEQSHLYAEKLEAEQTFVRYVVWAVPSVGFIGTVIGIAASLGYASEATTPEGIKRVTDSLSVAFDTTLVALVLSVVLMLYMHYVQKQQDDLLRRLKEYLLNNLINRFYR